MIINKCISSSRQKLPSSCCIKKSAVRRTTAKTKASHNNIVRSTIIIILFKLTKPTLCFQYILQAQQEITAPEMLCFSGDASTTITAGNNDNNHSPITPNTNTIGIHSLPCPNTIEEVDNYPAMIMDEKGYVNIKLKNVILRDDGRRRSRQQSSDYEEDNNRLLSRTPSPRTRTPVKDVAHHLQIYLISLEEYKQVMNASQCCYELELQQQQQHPDLPQECTTTNGVKGFKDGSKAHDFRINAPRIGQVASVTAPMHVNAVPDTKINVNVKLRPTRRGKHMVVISNCAAELSLDPITNATLAKGIKAIVEGGLDIIFVSQYGELPLSMMGIIPFYAVLAISYAILNIIWWKRLRIIHGFKSHDIQHSSSGTSNNSPLGLQKAIHSLLLAQSTFTTMAFFYYLHLNLSRDNVDIHVLYNGTAAALISWKNPFSIIIAMVHFSTIFGCQCVATLASDGTWLIQSTVRYSTKCVLYLLAFSWLVYFISYSFLTISLRRYILLIGGICWIIYLCYNIQNSLRHLKSLMIGHRNDHVLAIGGAIVAKRQFYRKMCIVIAVYPVAFLLSLVYTNKNKEDSWAWLGYVLGDIYSFVLLLHASYIWIPRSMASQEFVKYAPLETSTITHNDAELWVAEEQYLDYDGEEADRWEEEEFELQLSS